MKKNLLKISTALVLSLLLVMPAFALTTNIALAAEEDDTTGADFWSGGTTDVDKDSIRTTLGLGSNDPIAIATSIVNVGLSFLGIVAVIIILLGGFKWMTAGGNEEKVEEAQKLIRAGIIGLIIIIAAWGIASFVIGKAFTATGGTGAVT